MSGIRDEKVYKDTYDELKKRGTTKLSYDKYMDRMVNRNEVIRKAEFEDRKIRL